MNRAAIDNLRQSVLYEGYILYPYRRSTKNTHRWTFGGIFPRGFAGEVSESQTQLLLRGGERMTLSIEVRFLQAMDNPARAGGNWQEATERSVSVEQMEPAALAQEKHAQAFSFPPIRGSVETGCEQLRDDFLRVTVRISNAGDVDARPVTREQASTHAMLSAHVLARVTGGEFVSLIDPPVHCADLARGCRNDRLWPVLVGETGQTDTVLAAPIILYDYPQLAPQSPGDLFDGTEIDEILSLRVLTLTDDEKRDAAALDDRAARLIERTHSLAREQLMRLHGTMRRPRGVEAVHVAHAELRAGDRVRLRPRRQGADAFDIILRGKTATIAAIEQDYENRVHLAVTIDDDPGADIGAAGKIGHRFFFRPDEVEPVARSTEAAP